VSIDPLILTTGDGGGDRLAAAIARLIVDGEFGPGDRLKLSDLAQRFGVSLTPVREALWKLEGSGLVENIPNRGAVVRGVDEQHIMNVYEVRGAIEAALIERAVAAATAGDLARIEAAQTAFDRAAAGDDRRALLLADADFHGTINAIAGNDLAVTILGQTLQLIRSLRLRVGFDPVRVREIVREHAEIVAAIREGDARAAAQRLRLHTNGARRSMIEALRRARDR
jgi:DNA-binding GntR family transcriptional regulator